MPRYHINSSGDPRICRATISCPFGDLENLHFDNPKEARSVYEKLTKEGTFPKFTKVYRIGSLTPPEKHSNIDELDSVVDAFDKFIPDDRQSRKGALFASASLKDHARWIRGIHLAGKKNTTNYELTVNANNVYVYKVDLYEISSSSYGRDPERFEKFAKEYWETGMRLSDFLKSDEISKGER